MGFPPDGKQTFLRKILRDIGRKACPDQECLYSWCKMREQTREGGSVLPRGDGEDRAVKIIRFGHRGWRLVLRHEPTLPDGLFRPGFLQIRCRTTRPATGCKRMASAQALPFGTGNRPRQGSARREKRKISIHAFVTQSNRLRIIQGTGPRANPFYGRAGQRAERRPMAGTGAPSRLNDPRGGGRRKQQGKT